EVENIDKAWKEVAEKIKIEVRELKQKILPLSALYSIGEHTRALLFALNDTALPSNVGGGYNLRVILRRALSFIEKYGWDIDMAKLAEFHAQYLKPIFPEVSENLEDVSEIMEEERRKFIATREKSREMVKKIVKEDISEEKLLQIYDSHGVAPELISEEARALGKEINVPDDFYARVAKLHEQVEQIHATERAEKLPLGGIPATEALYFDDYGKVEFSGKIIKIVNNNVVLDKTAFYPTSGGQMHDIGMINNSKVVDVFKQGNVIIHVVDKTDFKEGDVVKGIVESSHRKQLAQHHTSTHIVNAAARKVLGHHVNQAGAKKTREKAHLDITHYRSISDEELKRIEEEANSIVAKNICIEKSFVPRSDAEKRYGMALYQGGAVPGKMIRVVNIPGIDVEACAGTHLNSTGEAGRIKLLKATKIQDGVVRLTFTAGGAAESISEVRSDLLEEAARLLGVEKDEVPARAEELFEKWKTIVKKKKDVPFELTRKEKCEGDALCKTAEVLRTQPEHIVKTITRFLKDIEEMKGK
ncbi:alanine--tRNA ligase, partial [Candidatus Woesearchaeota archaeon]|nr:alanine--tRNA ligase [Candidatus Woesearchaeota archaeon]